MEKSKKLLFLILGGLLLVLAAGVAGYYFGKNQAASNNSDDLPAVSPIPTTNPAEGIVCTMDAKVCPDGSYVGRVGPNCEFAPCPGE